METTTAGVKFGDDLAARAREQLQRKPGARRAQKEQISMQKPPNPTSSGLQISFPLLTSKEQSSSSKQKPHPPAPGVDVALGITPFTLSLSHSIEESPLLDVAPDFRVNLNAVTMELSPLREEDFPSLSRKTGNSTSSQTYKRNKSNPSANTDKKIKSSTSDISTVIFAPPQLSSNKSLSANSCLPSPPLSKQKYSHSSAPINPFKPINIPHPPKGAMEAPVVIPPLVKILRNKGLACPYASYSSNSIKIDFPGKLIEAEGPTSSSLIASLLRAEDWLELDRYSSADLENKAAICELKAMGYRAMQSHRAQSYELMRSHIEELSDSVKRLKEENFRLQNIVAENSSSNAEAMKKEIADLEAEVQRLQRRDVEREDLVRSNLNLLEKAEAEKENLQNQMADLTKIYEAANVSLIKAHEDHKKEVDLVNETSFNKGVEMGKKEGLFHGQMQGAYMCKSYLLMTPPGQAFLKSLVGGLIEDFLHSTYFWERMNTPLVHWIVSIVDSCFTTLKLDDDRMSEIDPGTLFDLLRKSTPTLELHVPDSPTDLWYLKCLREAARILSSATADAHSFPAWEEILFPVLEAKAGKLELLRGVFDEIENVLPTIQQELTEAEQIASLIFRQRLLQRQTLSTKIQDPIPQENISGSQEMEMLPFPEANSEITGESFAAAKAPSEDIIPDIATTIADAGAQGADADPSL